MIYSHQLKTLTEDEMGMLLYALNTYASPGFGYEVDERLLLSYRKDILLLRLEHHIKPNVLEEHMPLFNNIVAKLNGTYVPPVQDQPTPQESTTNAPETPISN
jgi:hypothetical protein